MTCFPHLFYIRKWHHQASQSQVQLWELSLIRPSFLTILAPPLPPNIEYGSENPAGSSMRSYTSSATFLPLYCRNPVLLSRASQVVLGVKNLPANAVDIRDSGSIPGLGRSLGGNATHSHILAWRIPWTEEPGGPQSVGLQSRTQLKQLSVHALLCKSQSHPGCHCYTVSQVFSLCQLLFVLPASHLCQASNRHINSRLSKTVSSHCIWSGTHTPFLNHQSSVWSAPRLPLPLHLPPLLPSLNSSHSGFFPSLNRPRFFLLQRLWIFVLPDHRSHSFSSIFSLQRTFPHLILSPKARSSASLYPFVKFVFIVLSRHDYFKQLSPHFPYNCQWTRFRFRLLITVFPESRIVSDTL